MRLSDALTASPEQARTAYEGIGDSVNEILHTAGVSLGNLASRPRYNGHEYDGSMPENMDELSYDEIANLMRANAEWTRYLLGHMTQVQVELKIVEQQISAVKSSITRTRGKEYVDSDLRYIELNVQQTTLKCLATAFEAAHQIAKDAYKVLSRQVTIRGQDQERERRNDNFERGRTIRRSNR